MVEGAPELDDVLVEAAVDVVEAEAVLVVVAPAALDVVVALAALDVVVDPAAVDVVAPASEEVVELAGGGRAEPPDCAATLVTSFALCPR